MLKSKHLAAEYVASKVAEKAASAPDGDAEWIRRSGFIQRAADLYLVTDH